MPVVAVLGTFDAVAAVDEAVASEDKTQVAAVAVLGTFVAAAVVACATEGKTQPAVVEVLGPCMESVLVFEALAPCSSAVAGLRVG